MFWFSVAMFRKRPMRKRVMNSLPRPRLPANHTARCMESGCRPAFSERKLGWPGLTWVDKVSIKGATLLRGINSDLVVAPFGPPPRSRSRRWLVGADPAWTSGHSPEGLTAPHRWPDLGFLHAGYAPATCWAGLFGRLRLGGEWRPLEINPLITVMVGNCNRSYDHTSLVVHMTLIAQL